MKFLYKIITGLIIALGFLHLALTPFNYKQFDMDAFWFVGTGLAIILAGVLNFVVIRERGRDSLIRVICVVINVSFALLFAVALWKLEEPQVFIGFGLFGIAAFSSALSNKG